MHHASCALCMRRALVAARLSGGSSWVRSVHGQAYRSCGPGPCRSASTPCTGTCAECKNEIPPLMEGETAGHAMTRAQQMHLVADGCGTRPANAA